MKREIKNEKATINLNNKNDENCIQYAIPVALNHESFGRNPQNR